MIRKKTREDKEREKHRNSIPIPQPRKKRVSELAVRIENTLKEVDSRIKLALELQVEGYTDEEIAEKLSVSSRTIQRWRKQVKDCLIDSLDKTMRP